MIKRLYLNALNSLFKHYANDRVLELFLFYEEDIEAFKKGQYRSISTPDQQLYDLAVDWAQLAQGDKFIEESSDGYGVFCYDLPFTEPKKLPTRNVVVSKLLGRARSELERHYSQTLQLCRIMQSPQTAPFPKYVCDQEFLDNRLKQYAHNAPVVFTAEDQKEFGWGIRTQAPMYSVSCPALFNEKDSAVIVSALIKKLTQYGINCSFMLLKGTFAWQAYFLADRIGDEDLRWVNQYGEERLRLRLVDDDEKIPISGLTSSGYQVVWTELPNKGETSEAVSLDDLLSAVKQTARASGLIAKQRTKKEDKETPARQQSYVTESWMLDLINEFPCEGKSPNFKLVPNPFPILWTQAWRGQAQKNHRNSLK